MNPILNKVSALAKCCADVSYKNKILKFVHSLSKSTRLALKIGWSKPLWWSKVLQFGCTWTEIFCCGALYTSARYFWKTKSGWFLNLEVKVMETSAAASPPHQSAAVCLCSLWVVGCATLPTWRNPPKSHWRSDWWKKMQTAAVGV